MSGPSKVEHEGDSEGAGASHEGQDETASVPQVKSFKSAETLVHFSITTSTTPLRPSTAVTMEGQSELGTLDPEKKAPVTEKLDARDTMDNLGDSAGSPGPQTASDAENKKPEKTEKTEKKSTFLGIKQEHKTAVKDFVRIFSFSTPMDKFLVIISILSSVACGVTMPMMNVVFGKMCNAFTSYYSTDPQVTLENFRAGISQCALYLVYIFIIRLLLDYVAYLGFRMSSMRISAAIRLQYMRSLFQLPISTLDLLPPGQTAAIITITASILQVGISERLSALIQSITTVVSSLVIAFIYNWQLTLVTSSGLVLITAVYAITTPFLVNMMNSVQDAEIRASTIASEVFGSIRMITACGAQSKMAKRYAKWVDEARKRGLRMAPLVAGQQAPVFFTVYATFALCFWYSLKMYLNFEIASAEILVVVLMSVMLMTQEIGGVAGPLSAAARAAGCATVFYTIIDAKKPQVGGFKGSDVDASKDIILDHVNFVYPTRLDVKILDDLSLRFPAGKITAIVGPSGSGKSTIVALLQRWYELDGDEKENATTLWLRNGSIMVDGRSLKDIDIKWWRSQIGLVQQEPFLFNDTIFKNVAFGLVGTQWEDETDEKKLELVKYACQEAFADEFISRMPEGYDTIVGDAGIKLSGGQRQRLAIARSIVKQPKILILDEATSSIDVRAEQMVQAALDKVSKDRTTITIAHRLSTIKKADNIIVLRKGKLVQQGTHEELMSDEGGAYWTLATAQQLSMDDKEECDDEYDLLSDVSDKKEAKGSLLVDDIIAEDTATVTTQQETEEMNEKGGGLRSFGILLREQSSHWFIYTVLILAAIGAGSSSPLQAYLFATLLTLFQYWGDWVMLLANFWSLMFVMLAVLVGISYFALGWASTSLSSHITHTYRSEYFNNISTKPVSFYDAEDHSVGALSARLATDPTQLQQMLGTNMAFVIISLFSVVGCLTISFYFGWKLAVVTVCSSMPVILASAYFRIRYEQHFEKMNNRVFSESAKFATESIGAIRTVSALTLEDTICNRYEKLLFEHIRKAFLKSCTSTLIFSLSDSVALLCMAFVLWYGGNLMLNREYYPFQYMIVYIAVLQGGLGAGQWLSYGPNIAKASVAADRILEMRAKDSNEGHLVSLDTGNIGDDDKGVRVKFEDVWFKYPTRDVPILKGLDLTIEKGQFAALVGPSGSGKTTVVSLLERFYRAQSGQITYNGSDISCLSLDAYRRDISLVAQEPCLFDASIRENILLGVDEDTVRDEDIHQACRDAEIHDFVVSLPDGYNTRVGTRGVALSGGQKQRLSIARALIRNPRLLLLDEATSNLDAETEKLVQAVFERNKSNRTMIVVAHRLATVQNADVIFVMGDGKVMEKGDHATLLRKKGLYYQMCQSQALDR